MFGDGVVISDGQFFPTKPGHQYTPCILNSQIHRSELHTDLTRMKAGKSAQETIQISTKTFLFNPESPHSWPIYISLHYSRTPCKQRQYIKSNID